MAIVGNFAYLADALEFQLYRTGANRHEVEWDGTDFAGRAAPSGVCFYRLLAGRNMLARKMILLK